MRILLSAYACHPKTGSEARLGWRWALELAARGHEVWVLTREANRLDIEHELARLSGTDTLHFLYYDHARLLPWLKRLRARFRYFYYYAWQWGAYQVARRQHAGRPFDLVHHVTWVQARAPSFMGRLGIPFVFGPVGGGEAAPWRLRGVQGARQWLIDLLRDVWTLLARLDPYTRQTYRAAARIHVTTPESLRLVPRSQRPQANVLPAVAYEPEGEPILLPASSTGGLRLLYVGRFLGLKGMALGIAAFAALCRQRPESRLTLIGAGPAEVAWRKQARRLGIEDKVEWIGWMRHGQVLGLYSSYDALLFPSLHDSGGLVLLEAMAQGLPVVCLDLGGPGVIVDASCGIKIEAQGRCRQQVEKWLADALLRLADDASLRNRLRQGARERVAAFTWEKLIIGSYGNLHISCAPGNKGKQDEAA